jgi:transglutaminase-like putative cysteine protease
MKFGLVHRVMTDALAALGIFALIASGQFGRLVNVVVVIGLALAVALREPWRAAAARRHLDTVTLVLLIAVQLLRAFFTEASGVDLLIEFAVGLQIIRVATRRGAAHDQQVIVLALLHLIAGTVVGGGLGYGLCFIGLLVVTPGALVLSHLRREVEGNYRQGARDRTGLPVDVPRILRSRRVVGRQFIAVTCLLSVPILLFTVALFVLFPRVGLSLLLLNRPKSGRMIGFSGKVDLGQIGTLRSDPTIALRFNVVPEPNPPPARLVLHLRGTALDAYDGRTWSQSSKQSRWVASAGHIVGIASDVEPPGEPVMRLDLEPIDPPVLFLPPRATAIRLAPTGAIGPTGVLGVLRGPEGELRYQAPGDRAVRYEVFQGDGRGETFRTLRAADRGRYLQTPPELPLRVKELAETWIAGIEGDYLRAKAIEQRLRAEYRYDLSSPSGSEGQPLDHFLFESKRGHCEYYSTAMAVMLRLVGVPSRNVTGFVGGTYNRFGRFYAVRQGDAHSWVEAYLDDRGWVTFDPTPPAAATPLGEVEGALAVVRDFLEAISQRWNRHVLGYDLRQQIGLFDALGGEGSAASRLLQRPRWRVLLGAAGLALAGLGLYVHYRRRSRLRALLAGEQQPGSRDAAVATSLYELLDRAMSSLGIPRAAATPPLRHAELLQRGAHPLSLEVLSLTERYLEARFGHRPLSLLERRDYELRVRHLRLPDKGGETRAAPASAGAR